MKVVVNAAIIEDGKLLLCRKGKDWIFPGGKMDPEDGGSDLVCVCREMREEFSGTRLKDIIYYDSFVGVAPGSGRTYRAKVYFANINGRLYDVREGDSISEAKWVRDFSGYNLSDITSGIIDSLVVNGHLV